MIEDEPAGLDGEGNKDETARLDENKVKDKPAGQDEDVIKDEPAGLDGNVTEDEPAGLEDKPALWNKIFYKWRHVILTQKKTSFKHGMAWHGMTCDM